MEAFHAVTVGDSVFSYSAYGCGLGFQDFKYIIMLIVLVFKHLLLPYMDRCSLLIMFQIVTTNNWHEVMNTVRCYTLCKDCVFTYLSLSIV